MENVTDDELLEKVEEFVAAVIAQAKREYDRADLTSSGARPEITAHVGAVTKPTDAEIREHLSWLKPTVEEFLTPKPEVFDDMIDKMAKLESAFGTTDGQIGRDERLTRLTHARDNLATWRGQFTTALKNDYLGHFPRLIPNHGTIAKCLRDNAEALKGTYLNGRRNALRTLTQGIEAVDAIQDSRGADLQVPLSAVTGAPALPLPLAPQELGVALSCVPSPDAEGGAPEADAEEVPLGADTVQGVVENVEAALKTSHKKREEDEGRVAKELTTSQQRLSERIGDTEQLADGKVPVFASATLPR